MKRAIDWVAASGGFDEIGPMTVLLRHFGPIEFVSVRRDGPVIEAGVFVFDKCVVWVA